MIAHPAGTAGIAGHCRPLAALIVPALLAAGCATTPPPSFSNPPLMPELRRALEASSEPARPEDREDPSCYAQPSRA